MAMSSNFIQMLATLSDMTARRRQLDLQEEELGLRQEQLRESSTQFARTQSQKELYSALETLASASKQGREAFLQLQNNGKFSPEEMTALQAWAAGMPISPQMLGAEAANAGVANASPQQLAVMQQEAAARALTGMNVGGMGASQVQGAVSNAVGGNPNYINMIAAQQAGYPTPFQARQLGQQDRQLNIAQQNANIAQGGTEAQWAGLRQEDRKMIDDYNLGLLFGKGGSGGGMGGGGRGAMTANQTIDAMIGASKLLDDIEANKSTPEANFRRIQIYNRIVGGLGHFDMLIDENDPKLREKVGAFRQFIRSQGMGRAAVPPPYQPGPMPGTQMVPPQGAIPQQQVPMTPPWAAPGTVGSMQGTLPPFWR